MKFYMTFGQVHVHSINGKTFDKNCVAVINADNHEHARNIAFELTDGSFFTTHAKKPDMQYYPRGLIEIN